jgi:hypothetical protein
VGLDPVVSEVDVVVGGNESRGHGGNPPAARKQVPIAIAIITITASWWLL